VNVPAEIFRTYDIRGIVGRTLTPAIVRAIGRALGSIARERGASTFAVGRDGRLSGPGFSDALIEGMLAAGASAIDIGMAPTPVTYFAAHYLQCGSCVSITGSHNPPDYNGRHALRRRHPADQEDHRSGSLQGGERQAQRR
jgi:phosphomannomutase/phosphoglucomutase